MKKYIISSCIIMLLFASCNLGNTVPGNVNGTTDVEIQTISFVKQSDNSFLFETNDPENLSIKDKTFFFYDLNTVTDGSFTYTVKLRKSNGTPNGGFGLVFQRKDSSNFWVFNIDTRGYYYLAKVVKGNLITVFDPPWKFSNYIHTGYGIDNTIKIKFDGTKNYEIFANNELVISFSDNKYDTALVGGCLGLDAVVMSSENFPETPVRVSYTIITPVVKINSDKANLN